MRRLASYFFPPEDDPLRDALSGALRRRDGRHFEFVSAHGRDLAFLLLAKEAVSKGIPLRGRLRDPGGGLIGLLAAAAEDGRFDDALRPSLLDIHPRPSHPRLRSGVASIGAPDFLCAGHMAAVVLDGKTTVSFSDSDLALHLAGLVQSVGPA